MDNNKFNNWIFWIFLGLVFVSLLTPFWAFKDLLFPYITSKAFYFRAVTELALPFYVYLLITQKGLRPKLTNWLNLSVLIFFGANLIAAFFGVNVARSLWGNFERMGGVYYLAHAVLLFFYVQAIGQAGAKYIKYFLQIFIGIAAVLGLNGLSALIGGPTLTLDPSAPTRISSTFGNPIFFASYLIVPLCLSLYLALSEQGKLKFWYWAASAILLLSVYFSGTRGAVVGLIAAAVLGLVLYIIFAPKSTTRKYTLGIFIALILIGGLLYFNRSKLSPGSTLHRILNLRDTNSQARLVQWDMALNGFQEKPVFGVGPENYYYISNSYYNPEMYKYDPSWFDKPHNYFIEVLVTTGIVGFLPYLLTFIFAIFAIYKGYKSGLLSLPEACVLLGGLLAYQIQNFFVFDTVSATLAWFAFLGFVTFIWAGSQSGEEKKANFFIDKTYAKAVLAIALLLVFFLEYAGNITSIRASKRVNYGYGYARISPAESARLFASALAMPFNLDKRETGNYYSDFTAVLVGLNDPKIDRKFILEQLEKATQNQTKLTQEIENDPLLWMRLVVDDMNLRIFKGESVEPTKELITKTVALAPKRVELLQLWIQYYSYTKDWPNLVKEAEKIVELNPYNPELRWQLAMGYFLNQELEKAVAAGDIAVSQNFKFKQLQQFAWYIEYYQQKKDWPRVAALLQQAVELEPNEIGLYFELAKAYANMGNKEQAILLAEQVAKSDPSQKAAVEAFINSLK